MPANSRNKRVVSTTWLNKSRPFNESLEAENWPRCLKACPVILASGINTYSIGEDTAQLANLDQIKRDTGGYVIGCTGVEIFIGNDADPNVCVLKCPNATAANEVIAATPLRKITEEGR